jgi:hypothetical protein
MLTKALAIITAFLILSIGIATTAGTVRAQNETVQESDPEVLIPTTGQGMNETAEIVNFTSPDESATVEPETEQDIIKGAVILLLDSAESDIKDARNLLANLTAAQEQEQEQEQEPAAANETEQIVIDANQSAEDIVEIIETEVTNESAAVDDVSNATNDVVEIIEDSVQSNENATSEEIENVTEEVVEIVEEVIDPIDNSSAEVHAQSALIRLLTQIVDAQNYNENLTDEEKTDLQSTLQEVIVEQAISLADSLG